MAIPWVAPWSLLLIVVLSLTPSSALLSNPRLHDSLVVRSSLLQAQHAPSATSEEKKNVTGAIRIIHHSKQDAPVRFQLKGKNEIGKNATGNNATGKGKNETVAALEAGEKEEKIKEVTHDKHPGGGYKKGSPMYAKQQAALQANQPSTRLSSSMKYVIFLTVQFFIIYTTLFITQAVERLKPMTVPRLKKCMVSVAKHCYFIPMLCILFLVARMRAVQLSQGMTDKYNLPQWWVKEAMFWCTVGVTLNTITATLFHALLSKDPESKSSNPGAVERGLNAARFILIPWICLSYMTVCIGVCTMQAPLEVWGGKEPKVSQVGPVVICTIFLTLIFFAVHFLIEVVRTADKLLTPEDRRFSSMASQEQTRFLRDVETKVDIIPMLCILFVASHIRGLQLDPEGGLTNSWSQTFFKVASLSVLGLVLLEFLYGWCVKMEVKGILSKICELLRFACLFFLYFSAGVIIAAMMMQKRESGATPGIPPSLKCVTIVTVTYFIVYALTWIVEAATKTKRFASSAVLRNVADFLEKRTKEATDFAPMLCVLFLGTFLRALQLTGGKGAPQPWAQTFMYVATMAFVLLTVSRVDTVIFQPKPAAGEDVPDSASTKKLPASKVVTFFFLLQHLCLLLMHIAAAVVIYGLITMTAATATGTGSIASVAKGYPL